MHSCANIVRKTIRFLKLYLILVNEIICSCIKKRSFTFVQDDKVNNVIFRAKPSTTRLSEAKNLFLEVLKGISVLKELCLLLYQNLLSINNVNALDWLCYLAALEVINTFNLSAFRFHLFNACCLALLYRE